MKLITRNTDYAIRAICCIALQKGLVPVRHLSEELEMPHPFLRKILQTLTRGGFLLSVKGRGGGFKLKRGAKDISVLEIAELFQGKMVLTEHLFKGRTCPHMKSCQLKKKLDSIEKDLLHKLGGISIASII